MIFSNGKIFAHVYSQIVTLEEYLVKNKPRDRVALLDLGLKTEE